MLDLESGLEKRLSAGAQQTAKLDKPHPPPSLLPGGSPPRQENTCDETTVHFQKVKREGVALRISCTILLLKGLKNPPEKSWVPNCSTRSCTPEGQKMRQREARAKIEDPLPAFRCGGTGLRAPPPPGVRNGLPQRGEGGLSLKTPKGDGSQLPLGGGGGRAVGGGVGPRLL